MGVREDDVRMLRRKGGGGGGRGRGRGPAVVASVDVLVSEVAKRVFTHLFFLFPAAVDADCELVHFAEVFGVGEEFVLGALGDPGFDDEVIWIGLL